MKPPVPTPGTTDPLISRDPLGTEGELTPGPDDVVPFDDPDADVTGFDDFDPALSGVPSGPAPRVGGGPFTPPPLL